MLQNNRKFIHLLFTWKLYSVTIARTYIFSYSENWKTWNKLSIGSTLCNLRNLTTAEAIYNETILYFFFFATSFVSFTFMTFYSLHFKFRKVKNIMLLKLLNLCLQSGNYSTRKFYLLWTRFILGQLLFNFLRISNIVFIKFCYLYNIFLSLILFRTK